MSIDEKNIDFPISAELMPGYHASTSFEEDEHFIMFVRHSCRIFYDTADVKCTSYLSEDTAAYYVNQDGVHLLYVLIMNTVKISALLCINCRSEL